MGQYYAESERLWLQPLNVDDHLEGYHEMASDERIVKWSSVFPQVFSGLLNLFHIFWGHSSKDLPVFSLTLKE
jgi:hypothetical protein